MMGPTHIVGGAAAGLGVAYASGLGAEAATALTVGAVATAKLPDIDGKINPSPQHRSLPHSLLLGGGAAVVVALVLWQALASGAADGIIAGSAGYVSAATLQFVVAGGVAGYLAHLFLDAMTSAGIWLLMPKGKRLGLPKKYAIRTDSPKEYAFCGVLILAAIALGLGVFAGEVPRMVSF